MAKASQKAVAVAPQVVESAAVAAAMLRLDAAVAAALLSLDEAVAAALLRLDAAVAAALLSRLVLGMLAPFRGRRCAMATLAERTTGTS